MKKSAWGNWNPREVQQPFRPNPNGVGDRTTMVRWLLIGAGDISIFLVGPFQQDIFDCTFLGNQH